MKKYKQILYHSNRLSTVKKCLISLISVNLFLVVLFQGLLISTDVLPLNKKIGIKASVPQYWPTNGWRTSQPEIQGMSSAKLQELHAYIRDADLPLDSVIVVRNGYIVYEDYPNSPRYREHTLHILHSVTKSFTSALTGIAIQEGYIGSVHDTVLSYFPNRTIANVDAWKQNMTLEHLLNMMAGMEWDEWTYPYSDPRNDLNQMVNSGDCIQFMLDRNMTAPPGSVWLYNTGASHLLAGIIRQTTGKTPLQYGFEVLFTPLGITDVQWTSDSQGLNFGGSELRLKPRDMAKFGFLYLNNGTWDGQQIVPEAWVSQSRESAVIPWSGTGYGYLWWKSQSLGTFEARGLYNQWIIVNPENDLVIIFTATDIYGHIPIVYLVRDFIISAIGVFPLDDAVFPWEMTLTLSFIIGVPSTVIIIVMVRKKKRVNKN
ncbi:MAG: class C beta-lactamase-related serine hydrolase [Candidatus Lokiarchaeota archaeon]|nr:class C beta-lactamase-related serine hydrolase [Candidatus Lokiarchaeota archaeon]